LLLPWLSWGNTKKGILNDRLLPLDAIIHWTSAIPHDWSQVDELGNTALFYGCRSGAQNNITVVKYLLDQWPIDQIPQDVLNRCKEHAYNDAVVKILEHPEDSENIIVQALSDLELNEEGDDEDTVHLTRWLLYDLAEEDDGDY
jgi:hypothetical protein